MKAQQWDGSVRGRALEVKRAGMCRVLTKPWSRVICIYLLHAKTQSQAWLTGVFSLAGGPPPGGGAPWHLQNVLSDSVESSDDEFFDARGE